MNITRRKVLHDLLFIGKHELWPQESIIFLDGIASVIF